jgi:hypothetical protein
MQIPRQLIKKMIMNRMIALSFPPPSWIYWIQRMEVTAANRFNKPRKTSGSLKTEK